jgi:medium-chain acyl-[acyl-carrier-protein] hydrolase
MSGGRMAIRSSLWIRTTRPLGAPRFRLFCFPYAGAGASVFNSWTREFSTWGVEVHGVQLPGRENRRAEPPFDSLPRLAEAMATGLAAHFDLPFCFFGHSMGALLCFELTRVLRRRGLPQPTRLFLSGARAPDALRKEPDLHTLGDDEFIEQIAKRYNGIPEEVLRERELLELLLPALRADFRAFEAYRHKEEAPLNIPLAVFGGTEDPFVHVSELGAWRRHTERELDIQLFKGDHFFLISSRSALIEAIAGRLRREESSIETSVADHEKQ